MIALARHGGAADKASALASLNSLKWESLTDGERIDLLRAYGLTGIRLGKITGEEAQPILKQIGGRFPTGEHRVDRELSQMLVYLGVDEAIGEIVAEMKNSPSQENQIHYAMALRGATEGWTDELNQNYFAWFNEIQSARGGMSFGGFIENIKKAAVERLSGQDKQGLVFQRGTAPGAGALNGVIARSVLYKSSDADELCWVEVSVVDGSY